MLHRVLWLIGWVIALTYHIEATAMMGSGMGGIVVIDPPRGAPFQDPPVLPNVSSTPGIVEVYLEAKTAPVNLNGTVAYLQTYNGYYPGPTIKVNKGDTLQIHFRNSLPFSGYNMHGMLRNATNLHTHGLHVSPLGNADNIFLTLFEGEQFDFTYDLSLHPAGNLNFYHPHVHGNVAEQVWSGLAGALEVADDTNVLSNYETHILMLKDITLSNGQPAPYSHMDFMVGKEGNLIMVNGMVNPVLTMRPGQIQRWKIVNASNARFYKLSLANHTLYAVGTDGGLLDKPYPQSTILLSPGERIDVLVKASTTKGYYKLKSLPYNRGMGCASANQEITLMTVNITGTTMNQSLPSSVNPSAVRLNVPSSLPVRRLTLSMGGGMMGGMSAAINGIVFSEANAFTLYSNLGGYEIWEIYNQSSMDHPFHQHVNHAQVISISGGDSAYRNFLTTAPAWKDTVIIPAGGSVKLLVPVMDFAGRTVFHCHILEHEDIGMMGIWEIR